MLAERFDKLQGSLAAEVFPTNLARGMLLGTDILGLVTPIALNPVESSKLFGDPPNPILQNFENSSISKRDLLVVQ